jgi:hypothetical protein
VIEGLFDELPAGRLGEVAGKIRKTVSRKLPDLCGRIVRGEELEEKDREAILELAGELINRETEEDADSGDAEEADE